MHGVLLGAQPKSNDTKDSLLHLVSHHHRAVVLTELPEKILSSCTAAALAGFEDPMLLRSPS